MRIRVPFPDPAKPFDVAFSPFPHLTPGCEPRYLRLAYNARKALLLRKLSPSTPQLATSNT